LSLELEPAAEGGIAAPRWLWEGRIALGSITLLAGQESHGKTTALCWLSALASNGRLEGDLYGTPSNVLYLSAEDDRTRTLNPRLDAAGADLNRVFHPRGGLSLPDSVPELARVCHERDVQLVIVDPVNSYLDAATNSHNDQSVRSHIGPVAAWAEHAGLAVVFVLHTNKGSGTSERDLLMGSAGYRAAARNTLLMGLDVDQSDEHGPLRALVHGKHNLGPRQVGHKLEIAVVDVTNDDGTLSKHPVLHERGETWWTAEQVLLAGKAVEKGPSPRDEAAEWLSAFLADGPRPTREVTDAAKAWGHSQGTLKRARTDLRVRAFQDGFHGGWMLGLPLAVDGPDGPRTLDHDSNHPLPVIQSATS